ncbi:DUF1501 domain-containing protein [Blastopirellula sp. JC732]|uniref:DUF1501 domain-containing protein n=1 Tax=Blastopirellula sediminis TaxID=2894196 RepID=A0A9X1MS00_9BACT|nr:DUF1501 domain-containing protein [Blastopirellula sediminis]MCC9605131.1 DUF1501 domain-containing protein [Blastopirellula sediminis]MCC9631569.1 DUF1501 domain-containing protein [Blastopirellula sediminis]
MFFHDEAALRQTRRTFLGQGMAGLGSVALASLLNSPAAQAEVASGAFPNFAPKAKRVIVLCQAGGPSHLETFDEKPELKRLDGQPMPESFTKGQPIAQLQGQKLKCFAPRFDFNRYGESGQSIVSLFPKMGAIADQLCIVNSMVTEQINHDPAHTFMNTGTSISGRPSMGSWVQYGLGSEADDLPGFVVLTSIGKGGQAQPIAARQWHSGFLPSRYQGVEFRSAGDPVLYVNNPPGITAGRQRDVVDAVNQMNALRQPTLDDPEIATRIAQYELAFKMQTSVPSLMDVSGEPQHILDMYGTKGADGTFAANCLLARRLAERGVRFIQLYHRGWDHHGGIERSMQICASEVDQASAALVTDLKNRGMLDDTLVVWGGEFGRTPMAQGNGRDHHIKGFSIWMAGGGIQGGLKYGKTDELGYNAVEDVMHVHDFHATMLHLLGINHEKLTFRHQGRDFRLTDVHGRVVNEILA